MFGLYFSYQIVIICSKLTKQFLNYKVIIFPLVKRNGTFSLLKPLIFSRIIEILLNSKSSISDCDIYLIQNNLD